MKFFLFFLAVIAVTYGNPYADEGVWRWTPRMPKVTPNLRAPPFPKAVIPKIPRRHDAVDPAIVGGQEATPHAYPWQAALFIDGAYFCGGSLISNSWVLTAAHCTDGASTIVVVLGAHDLSENEATQVTVSATNIIDHPSYDSSSLNNDVALVQISAVSFTPAIQAIDLPCAGDSVIGGGVELTTTGWGRTSDSSDTISYLLKEVTNPSITNSACASVYGTTVIVDATLCMEYVNGGTCNGDSGGPLIQTSGGTSTLRGVTSFGASVGCEAGYPAGFSRTLYYLDFIQAYTGISIC